MICFAAQIERQTLWFASAVAHATSVFGPIAVLVVVGTSWPGINPAVPFEPYVDFGREERYSLVEFKGHEGLGRVGKRHCGCAFGREVERPLPHSSKMRRTIAASTAPMLRSPRRY